MTMAFRKIFPIIAAFALFLALTGAAGLAWAQFKDNTDGSWKTDDGVPLVVELFTSTNCSACMPADRLLYDISKEKNVIALGCHINYWDEHTLTDPTGLEEERRLAYVGITRARKKRSGRLSQLQEVLTSSHSETRYHGGIYRGRAAPARDFSRKFLRAFAPISRANPDSSTTLVRFM